MAVFLLEQQVLSSARRGATGISGIPPESKPPKKSKDHFLIFRKKWMVEGSKESSPEYYFKYKNAVAYADSMNQYSREFFGNEVFTVKRAE